MGADGAAVGVANNTKLNVYEMLKAVDREAVNGELFAGNRILRDKAIELFDALNWSGWVC